MILLPPERSHICIALGSVPWAHALAGSGVGAAAAADGDAAVDGAVLAGGAALAPELGAEVAVPELQALISKTATTARAGSLRWVLIRSSSKSNQLQGFRPMADGPPT